MRGLASRSPHADALTEQRSGSGSARRSPGAELGWRAAAGGLLAALLAVPLVGYAATGSFARYTADDYCWAGVLRTDGFLKAQALWYVGYSPRYAFTFLVNVVELAGPAIVPVLPALAIVAWLATLTWAFAQFRLRLGGMSTIASGFLLAEVAAFGVFQTAPDLPQSLYWQTGMLTYLLPLVLATFLIGWIRRAFERGDQRPWTLAISGLVTFVAGGLSETYLIPQNVALTLALLVVTALALEGQTGWVVPAHLGAALAGGVAALLVIVVAPSTASRVGGSPADLLLTLAASVATGWYQVLRLLRFFPLAVLLSVGLPALLGNRRAGVSPRWFGVISLVAAVTATFCYFPSFYAQNGNPPTRSLIVPGAIFIGYLMFVGYCLQAVVQDVQATVRVGAAIVLVLAPVGFAATRLPQQVSAAQSAAAIWDAEDQRIRATRDAGQADVLVPRVPPFLGEQFVTGDSQDWFNICVARYYDVRSIATTSGAP